MNAFEQLQKTEEAMVKIINDSGLPVTTIHYMLNNLDRQVIEAMSRPIEEKKEE